jgi:hypothetical protein
MRALLAISLVLCSTASLRAQPRQRDVASTLERSMRLLSKDVPRRVELWAGGRGALGVSLLPQTRTIVLHRGFSQRGLFVGGDGRLSAADRADLERVAGEAGLTRGSVLANLRGELSRRRAEDRELAKADGRVDALLTTALRGGEREQALYDGPRASISYRPTAEGGILVVDRGLSSRGFLLSRGADGFTLSAEDRREIQRALLNR